MDWIGEVVKVASGFILGIFSVLMWRRHQKNKRLDDPLHSPKTAFGELDEKKYKAEVDLAEKYQSFTAEILRLSLLGIAVFGFLYKEIFNHREILNATGPTSLYAVVSIAKILAALGILMFAISAACALAFRYFATEGVRYYIEALRFLPEGKGDDESMVRAEQSLKIRCQRIKICVWTKLTAAITLGLGGAFVAIAFVIIFLFT